MFKFHTILLLQLLRYIILFMISYYIIHRNSIQRNRLLSWHIHMSSFLTLTIYAQKYFYILYWFKIIVIVIDAIMDFYSDALYVITSLLVKSYIVAVWKLNNFKISLTWLRRIPHFTLLDYIAFFVTLPPTNLTHLELIMTVLSLYLRGYIHSDFITPNLNSLSPTLFGRLRKELRWRFRCQPIKDC